MGPCCASDKNEEESRGMAQIDASKIVLQRKEKPVKSQDQ
jgi:hypothetical protein